MQRVPRRWLHFAAPALLTAMAGAMAVFFGLVRLPMDLHGDRVMAWLRRAAAFYRQERRASYFGRNGHDCRKRKREPDGENLCLDDIP